jgi:hypothetical protein
MLDYRLCLAQRGQWSAFGKVCLAPIPVAKAGTSAPQKRTLQK